MYAHVLLVEHDDTCSCKLAPVLRGFGYDVTVTSCGETALHWLREAAHGFDVVVTCLDLPDMAKPLGTRQRVFHSPQTTPGGICLIRELRALQLEHVPIIVWSRQDATELRIQAFGSGADDVVLKTIAPNELYRHIERLISYTLEAVAAE